MTGLRGGAVPWDTGTGVAGFHWPSSTPRAAVLLQHGLSEYSERYVDQYSELIPALLRHGISVYAIDLEGHGRSAGRRADTDVSRSVFHHQAARRCLENVGQPLFLFGHSLGGLVTATSVLNSPLGIAGVMLSSAALLVEVPWYLRQLAPVLGRWLPQWPVGRLDPDGISRIPERVQAMMNDPMKYHGRLNARMAASILQVSAANWSRYPQWTSPVLALHGTADRYTDCEGSRRFIETITATDKTLLIEDGGYHELLNDIGGERVLQVVLTWLDDRIKG